MAKGAAIRDIGLKVLIGLLFICIGVEGVASGRGNDLYSAIGDDTINIILGIVLIVCGLLIIVPLFVSGIKSVFSKWSTIIVAVVWVLVIIFTDFVNGFGSFRGIDFFIWLETFIYHLLILFCILYVCKDTK